MTISGKTLHEHMDIKGHHSAYQMMLSYVSKNTELTEDFIKRRNEFVTLDKNVKEAMPGYRQVNVYIGTKDFRVYDPSKHELISDLMKTCVETFNADIKHFKKTTTLNVDIMKVLTNAAKHHAKIITIHPFEDGNGITEDYL